jgi:hypothetical protein
MDRSGYLAYARDALDILAENLRLYRSGAPAGYRVAAVQLRLLLCDTNRVHDRVVDIALIPRLFPEMRLDPPQISRGADLPGRIRLSFPTGPSKLSLQEWLAQEVPVRADRSIRLRELIRLICEQDGGAHVDPRAAGDLRSWDGRDELIANLGEYVLSVLQPLLSEDEHRAA